MFFSKKAEKKFVPMERTITIEVTYMDQTNTQSSEELNFVADDIFMGGDLICRADWLRVDPTGKAERLKENIIKNGFVFDDIHYSPYRICWLRILNITENEMTQEKMDKLKGY